MISHIMANVIDGTYFTILNKLPTKGNVIGDHIGVIGHMMSGVKYDTNGAVTQTLVAGTDWEVFTNSSNGVIYEFNNFSEVVEKFGNIPEVSWTSGTYNNDGADISSYDPKYNLIRQLELIYQGNPSAKTKVAVLTGSGTNSSSDAGISNALNDLLKYEEIGYIVGSGMDLNSTLQTHVSTASNDTNKSERIYVGGTSIQKVFASGSMAIDLNASAGNSVDWSALKDDSGRTVFFVANAKYKFLSDHPTADVNGYEVGGNFLAGYVAGLLSSITENTSLIRMPFKFQHVYNGNLYRWTPSDQETLINNNVLHVRSAGGATSFSRALTYGTASTKYKRITTRRIIDRVMKEVRSVTDTYVGMVNNDQVRSRMRTSIESALYDLVQIGLVNDDYNVEVFVQNDDVANGIVRVSVIFKPVFELEFINVTLTVNV